MRIPVVMSFSLALTAVLPAIAQVRSAPMISSMGADDQNESQRAQQQQRTPIDTNQSGRVTRSSVGQVGQRQTRDAVAQAGIKPMARITSRIQSRVQNRIRNRIDRDYDPQANVTDPFIVAEDQARTTIRLR